MKINLLLFLILPFIIHAQNDNEYYNYKLYRVNLTQGQALNYNKDVVDYVGLNKVDTIDYELVINNKEATFSANQKLFNDQGGGLNFTEIIIQSNGNWYYDLADSVIYNTIALNGKKFSIKYDFDYIDWHYSQEVESIGGYLCKTATYSKKEELMNGEKRDYDITVWYSEEIGTNAIPFGFVGLSGGIVKINFNDFTEVILGEFGHDKRKKIKSFNLGNVVSITAYEDIQSEQLNKDKELRSGGVDTD